MLRRFLLGMVGLMLMGNLVMAQSVKSVRSYYSGFQDGAENAALTLGTAVVTPPVTVYTGDSVVLVCRAGGADAAVMRYEWRKLGDAAPLSTGGTLKIDTVRVADAGRYYCKVTNGFNGDSFYADTVQVTVKESRLQLTGVKLSQVAFDRCSGERDSVMVNYTVNTDSCGVRVRRMVARGEGFVPVFGWQQGTAAVGSDRTYRFAPFALSHNGKYKCNIELKPVPDYITGVQAVSDSCEVVVNDVPVVQITSPLMKIAEGVDVLLQVEGARSYRWTTGEVTDTLRVAPLRTTTYGVKGHNGAVCAADAEITIEVICLEVSAGTNVLMSVGRSATLTARTNVDTVRWYRLEEGGKTRTRSEGSGSWIFEKEGKELTVTPLQTTKYKAEATFCGVTENSFVTVFVKQSRSYHSGFQDGAENAALTMGMAMVTPPVTVYTGDSVVLVCQVGGADAAVMRYEWRKLGDATPLSTGGTLKIDTVRVTDAGRYYCKVTNGFNGDSFYADTVRVTVKESRLQLTGVKLSQVAFDRCSGERDSVMVNYIVNTDSCGVRVRRMVARGEGFVPVFGWQQGTAAVGSDRTYRFAPFALSHNGKYKCNIELKPVPDYITGVQAVSDSCEVVVNDIPVVQITSPLMKIAEGVDVLLQVEGARSYRWTTGEVTDTLRVAPLRTTTYGVKGHNGAVCAADAEITIEVICLEISAGANVLLSVGRSATLTARTNVDTVRWYRLEEGGKTRTRSVVNDSRIFEKEGKELTVTPLQTTKYEAEATFCGVTASSFVTVFVKQSRSYYSGFQDGAENVSVTLGNPMVKLPAMVYTGDSALLVCSGAGADKGVLAYEWRKIEDEQLKRSGDSLKIDTVRLTDGGKYYCLVTNRLTQEETSSDTVELVIRKSRVKIKELKLSVNGLDRCEEDRDSVAMSYTVNTDSCGVRVRQLVATGKGFHTEYKWWRKGVLTGEDSLRLFPQLAVADTGFYKGTVTLVPERDYLWGDTRQSDSIRVEVRRYPVVKISAPAEGMMVCLGTELILDGRSTEQGNVGGDVYVYAWSGAGITGATNTAQTKAVPPATTTWRLTVNNRQCSRYEEVTVQVYVPAIDLPGTYTVTAGDWVTLLAKADPDAMVTWRVGGRQMQDELATVPFRYGPVEGSERIYAAVSRYGCWAEDSCLLMVRSSRAFHSGSQDGHTLGCIAPVITGVKNTAKECTGEEAAFRVLTEGTDLHYRWEKYNEVTFEYDPFVPPHAGITGMEMPELRFKAMAFGDEGVYRCVVWNECGEEESEPFSLSLEGAPVLHGSLKKLWEMCEGPGKADLAVVAVSPNGKPLSYQWFKNGNPISGATQPGYTVSSSQKSAEGLYRIEVLNACDTVSDTARVMIYQPARVPNDYQKQFVGCNGSRVEFTMQPLGGGSYDIELREVTVLPGGTADKPLFVMKPGVAGRGVKVVRQVTLADHGKTFVWTVKNDCGADTSGLVSLSVEKQPTIASFTRGPLTICAGHPLTLNCETTGDLPGYTYQWYKNDRPVGTGKEFTIKELAPEDAGLYRCGVNNQICVGQVFTDQIEVRIQQPPVVNRTITVTGQDYCLRRKLTLAAKVYDTEPVDSVRWYHNDRPLYDKTGHYSGASTATLTIEAIAATDGGPYYLRAWNRCNYTNTDPWSFTVDFPARFVTDLNGYTDLKLCAGDNQVVSVQAEGTAPIMYMWTRNKVKITEGYTNSITLKEVNVDSTGEYCCEIHNKCTDEAVRVCAKINVYAPPLFTLTGDEYYCAGGDESARLYLSGSDAACTYELYRDGVKVMTQRDTAGAPLVFSPVYAGVYQVVAVLDSNDCRRTMDGQVTVHENKAPHPYVIYLKTPYCQGTDGGVLALDTTETSVSYQLYQQVGNQWRLIGSGRNGTGGAMAWSGLKTGHYRMEAVNRWTGCTATLLPGIVEIVEHGLPSVGDIRFLNNDSLYCANEKSDVALQVRTEEAGCSYLLVRNGADTLQPDRNSRPAEWKKLEQGTYRVVSRNGWGCQLAGSLRKVKTQAVPQRFDFSGSAVYCKNNKEQQALALSGSRIGIDYILYRAPADSVTLVAGTGNGLTWTVAPADAVYLVIAKDRTPEQCRDTMNGRADIHAALLAAVGNPATLQVDYPGKATLALTVSGAVEPVVYAWEPAALVAKPGEKLTETIPLEEGRLFTAVVRDATGCTDTATVAVTVNGGPLRAEIRLANRVTPVDTVRLCADQPLSLYGWQDGGVSGNYQPEWLEGGRVVASGQPLGTFKKKSSGYLYFRVSRGNMGPVSDSVWVALQDTVRKFELEEDGLNCVTAGKQKLTLSGSDAGIKYRLEYSAGGVPPFVGVDSTVAVAGKSVALESGAAAYGFYRIRAINGICNALMTGVAEFRQEPAVFEVSGSCGYCGSRGADTIYLSGAEAGVTYELYRGTAKIESRTVTQAGPQLFTGAYGAGEYSVQAVYNSCRMYMRGTALIRIDPLPLLSPLLGCGAFCDKDLPRHIQVATSEPDVDYMVMRYAVRGSAVRSRSFAAGNPVEQFPLPVSGYRVDKIGRYEVLATNRLTGCSRLLTDTLLVEPTPAPVNITGGGETCDPTGNILTKVKIWPVEAGISYVLYDKWGAATWNISNRVKDTLFFADLLPEGTYLVRAEAGGCPNKLSTEIKAERITFPMNTKLDQAGSYCASLAPAVLTVNVSRQNTLYRLMQVANGNLKEVDVVSGDGKMLSFARQTEVGEYYVEMSAQICVARVSGTVQIMPEPRTATVTGSGFSCAATGGIAVQVKVTPARQNTTYTLHLKNGADIGEVKRSGADALYNGSLAAGIYQVRAQIGQCTLELPGEVEVKRVAFPADPKIGNAGNHCSSGENWPIVLDRSAVGTDYILEQAADGVRKEIERIPGRDAAVSFGEQKAPGTYYVVMEKSGCRRQIADTLMLTPIPALVTVTGGGADCDLGSGKDAEIRIQPAETGVEYKLYDQKGVIRGTFVAGSDPEILIHRNKLEAGAYVVKGSRGACSVTMKDTVKFIELNKIQDLALDGAGEYCSTSVPALGMKLTESGVTYTLWRETYGGGAVELIQKPGGGPVTFGTYTDAGRYYVTAVNVSGCKRRLTQEVRIGQMPAKPEVFGGGTYCASEQGANLIVKMRPWSEGATYLLCPTGSQVGPAFGFPNRDTLYYNGLLTEGEYKAVAALGNCRVASDGVVRVEKLPVPSDVAVMVPAGDQCLSGDQEIRLNNAEANIIYRLYRKDNAGDVQVAELTNGSFGKVNVIGAYYVTASFPDATGCTRPLSSTLRLKAAPAKVRVSGGSDYCAGAGTGGAVAEVKMWTHQVGVSYKLVLTGTQTEYPFGSPNKDSLYYRGVLSKGNYVAVATQNGCSVTSDDHILINELKVPADRIALQPAGDVCLAGPVEVKLTGAEPGVSYQLYRQTADGDEPVATLSGNGSFGLLQNAGEYYVQAAWPGAEQCGVRMTSKLRLKAMPVAFRVTGGGMYCEGTAGAAVTVSAAPAENDLVYRLYALSDGRVISNLTDRKDDALSYTGMLTEGKYVVRTERAGCRLEAPDTVKITKRVLLLDNLYTPLSGCEGVPLTIGVTGSQQDVIYELWKAGKPDVKLLTKEGDGLLLGFGNHTELGRYYLVATDRICGITKPFVKDYLISPAPRVFDLTGGGEYCASGAGVSLGLSGSENGVPYRVQRADREGGVFQNVATGNHVGDGTPFIFPGVYKEGYYRAVADNGCELPMNTPFYITSLQEPDTTLRPVVSGACQNGKLQLTFRTEDRAVYTLIWNYLTDIETLTGDGNQQTFTVENAPLGTYVIRTELNGCDALLSGKAEVGKLPVKPELQGDRGICGVGRATLTLTLVQAGTTYRLRGQDGKYYAGGLVNGVYTFKNIPAGTYVAEAGRGDCHIDSDQWVIKALQPGQIASNVWTAEDCVAPKAGVIHLKNLSSLQEYILTGATLTGGTKRIDGAVGSIDLTALSPGEYHLMAQNKATQCLSDTLTLMLREEAFNARLTADTTYCQGDIGARLSLQMSGSGMEYSILSLQGNVLEKIASPQTAFSRDYRFGKYILYKQRVGTGGGCKREEVFEVKMVDLPNEKLSLTTGSNGALCFGNTYQVTVQGSEADVKYTLLDKDNKVLETRNGNGGDLLFNVPVFQAGYYTVRADRAGCSILLDTVLQIHEVPAGIMVTAGGYCSPQPGQEESGGVISLGGMKQGIHYILTDFFDYPLDTIARPATVFEPQTEGVYRIKGEDPATKCSAVLDVATIVRHPSPAWLSVENACGTSAEVALLDRSEGSSVTYRLYRNGVYTGTEQPGNDGRLSFGVQTVSGIYRVWAETAGGCRVLLNDSVLVYPPAGDCRLAVNGELCLPAGASFAYEQSVTGWHYYVTGGLLCSDTLAGSGGRLVWNRVGGAPVQAGSYHLVAYNVCQQQTGPDTTVTSVSLPVAQSVQGGDILCSNAGTDFILDSSEPDVEYRLEQKQPWKVYPTVRGTGNALKLNNVSLTTGGLYTVYAHRDGSLCETVVVQKTFTEGKLPQFLNVIGSNLCTSAGSGQSIELCMGQREPGVDYILYHIAGVATEQAMLSSGGSVNCFPLQNQPGVYKVVGQNNQSGCRRDMLNLYSIGEKANRYSLENGGRKVGLCPGQDTVIRLLNSDIGVTYQLLRDGVTSGGVVPGTGHPIVFARTVRGGKYTVKAFNACGEEGMGDTVTVVENPLPALQVRDTAYHYCADLAGVQVEIFNPVAGDLYSLLTLSMEPLEVMQGRAGKQQHFTYVAAEGKYKVTATNPATGCVRMDSVRIKSDPLPVVHQFYSSGEYICPKGAVELRLDGSDRGISYTLYREGTSGNLGEYSGSGEDLLLRKLSDPGVYRAEARDVQTGCRVAMRDTLDIRVAGELIPYVVTASKAAYCYTDITKGTVDLSGSSAGVNYTLMQNGKPWALPVAGSGNALQWLGVDGRDCALDTGYTYIVLAQDVLTTCTKLMNNKVSVVEEQDAEIRQFHPNKSLKVCPGELQDFNVVAGGCNLSYNWYRRIGEKDTLIQDPAVVNVNYYRLDPVTLADYGTYWCEVTNLCSVKAIAPRPAVQLQLNRPVTQPEKMKDYRICVNDQHPVTLDAGMRGAVDFEWYKLGDEELKQYDELLTLTEYKDGDTYVCRASNDCNTILDTCIIRIDGKASLEILRGDSVALCQGGRYQLEIKTAADFVWQRNGTALTATASVLTIDPVTTADEGRYTVRLLNGCNDTTVVVGDLLVDEPLHVKEVTPGVHPVVCVGRPITLSVEATPSKRATYEWYYGTTLLDNRGPLLHIPAVEKSTTLQTYTVYFRNACESYNPDGTRSDFVQIRIELNDSIRYIDPERQVIACADASKEVVLRVGHPVEQLVTYQWSWFNHEKDTVTMPSLADTIAIPLSSSRNGYYFCRLYNQCGAVATRSTWFRVDSIPTPLSGLENDTLCEGASLRRTLATLGGSMSYSWILQDKQGKIDTISRTNQEFFESESELFIPSVTMAYDSARIWCFLRNGCGTDVSNTMLLRVRPAIRMELSPDTVSVCGLENGRVYLGLTVGDAPWSYSYRQPDGQKKTVKALAQADTLLVSLPGEYQVTGFSDGAGCHGDSDLPAFTVFSRDIPVAHVSGGGDRCPGDTVSIRLQITGGDGPWKIWFADKRSDVLPFASPFKLYGRDTLLLLTAMDSAFYYVDMIEDTYGGPASGSCPGISDGKVEISVHVPDMVDFALNGEASIGQCRTVKLHEKLRPALRNAGTKLTGDYFYLNGSVYPLAGSELTKDRLALLKGEQTIVYRYMNEYGCLVTSDEVVLTVDTLPFATLDAGDGHACGNMQTVYTVALSGAPKFTLEMERRLLKYAKYNADEDYRKWKPVMEVNDVAYNGEQMWTDADSCMILRVVSVTDRHGCYVTDHMPSDTVYHHLYPDLEIQTRYPNVEKSGWTKGMSPVYIARGDSVGVKATLTQGDRPWNLKCDPVFINGIHGVDTVFALDTGRYRITAGHEYCNVSASYGEELVVSYRDTGYLKMKVLLDGPLDQTSGKMHRDPKVNLPLYGVTALPDLSKVPGGEIIDWIEVELRNGNNIDSIARMGMGSLLITRDTCLLWSDGTVTDRLGDTVVALPGGAVPGYNNYYVVVRHRNHLAVMSSKTYPISRSRTRPIPTVDFTKAGSIYIAGSRVNQQGLHMSELGVVGRTRWALSAGDMNANALVSVFDPNKMSLDKLTPEKPGISAPGGYDIFDVNFDGLIGWPGWGKEGTLDWDKVRKNRHKFTEIRF